MHVLIIHFFCLIIILSNVQQTIASDCRCECCTSANCNPTVVGVHSLWYCSEASTCKQANCIDWHLTQCPPQGIPGQTRAICTSNAYHILPTFSMIIIACFYKVFVPNNSRRPIQKMTPIIKNTTRIMITYPRPTPMPQIRLDWLIKFGLLNRTSTSSTTHFFKQRY